jgi:antitoxin SocA-like protein
MGTSAGQVDDRKIKELILYLASKSEQDPRFSATKLNKLLFYCDFASYRRWGRAITGHSYQKLQFGPAPKAMLPLLEQMKLYLAEQMVADLWESNARQVSDLSHDFIGWKVAHLNEVIPYETVYVGDPALPLSDAEIEFCRQLEAEI